ncbi:DUF4376 domain-containing protein [Salmonella enterica]|nr:DUF4376 domain-containing protein [Salmonella enterica]
MPIITSVHAAGYLNDGTILADVQFDGATNADGTPTYISITVTDDNDGPDAQLLAAIKEKSPLTVPEHILEAAKRTKRAEINIWRDKQENADYIFSFNNHKWDYGKATQERMSISLAIARRNALPAGFAWTDGDNNIVPMDNAGLIALATAIEQAMFEKGMQINLRQLQMKTEVEALTTLDAIRNYRVDWTDDNGSR